MDEDVAAADLAQEDALGNVSVLRIVDVFDREQIEPLLTQAYRIRYGDAEEIARAVSPLLSNRGNLTDDARTGTLTVQDIRRVVDAVTALLGELDRPLDADTVR